MARKSQIARNELRARLYLKYKDKQSKIKQMFQEAKSIGEKIKLAIENSRIPLNSRKVRYRKRCNITGRARGLAFADLFRLCRFQIRMKARNGELPGVVKDR